MKEFPVRKNIRLSGYDYSRAGRYFITICIKDGIEMLGVIAKGNMQLSEYGRVSEQNLREMDAHIKGVRIDKYVIMPNHVHMILAVDGHVGTPYMASVTQNQSSVTHDIEENIASKKSGRTSLMDKSKKTVSRAIQQYKASVTRDTKIDGLWQRSFHDHIIRDEEEYTSICRYIDKNPSHWQEDYYFMENKQSI